MLACVCVFVCKNIICFLFNTYKYIHKYTASIYYAKQQQLDKELKKKKKWENKKNKNKRRLESKEQCWI